MKQVVLGESIAFRSFQFTKKCLHTKRHCGYSNVFECQDWVGGVRPLVGHGLWSGFGK